MRRRPLRAAGAPGIRMIHRPVGEPLPTRCHLVPHFYCLSAGAHGAKVIAARFETANLPLRLSACQVVPFLYAHGEAAAVTANSREIRVGELAPIRQHQPLEVAPVGARSHPVR